MRIFSVFFESIGILAAAVFVLFIIYLISSSRQKAKQEKDEKQTSDYNKEWLSTYEKDIVDRASSYKKNHKDWNDLPNANNCFSILAICYVSYNGERKKLYVRFHDISFSNSEVVVRYQTRGKSGFTHGANYEEHTETFGFSDFNKTWFVNESLALEQILLLSKFHDSTIINKDPVNLYSDPWRIIR